MPPKKAGDFVFSKPPAKDGGDSSEEEEDGGSTPKMQKIQLKTPVRTELDTRNRVKINKKFMQLGIYQQHRGYGYDDVYADLMMKTTEEQQAIKLLSRPNRTRSQLVDRALPSIESARIVQCPLLYEKYKKNPGLYDLHVNPQAEPSLLMKGEWKDPESGETMLVSDWHKIGSTWSDFVNRERGYKIGYFGVLWDFSQTVCNFRTYDCANGGDTKPTPRTLEEWLDEGETGKNVVRCVIEHMIEKQAIQNVLAARGHMELKKAPTSGRPEKNAEEQVYCLTGLELFEEVNKLIQTLAENGAKTMQPSLVNSYFWQGENIPLRPGKPGRQDKTLRGTEKISNIQINCRYFTRIHNYDGGDLMDKDLEFEWLCGEEPEIVKGKYKNGMEKGGSSSSEESDDYMKRLIKIKF